MPIMNGNKQDVSEILKILNFETVSRKRDHLGQICIWTFTNTIR